MLALLFASAIAGGPEPSRCEAVFTGPIDECPLNGRWVASGFGRTERRAQRNATERLRALIAAEAEARVARLAPGPAVETARASLRACPQRVADVARVHCYAEPVLTESRLCFASFEDLSCWRGPMFDLEGVSWRMMEEGRELVCDALSESLVEAPSEERARCEARCLQEARVRCPG